jgi:prevent-host-death family protein
MPKVAAVSELKASLSKYLAQVKAGEEVVVTERGKPIARVIPFPEVPAELEHLYASGAIRAPRRSKPLPDDFWDNMVEDPEGWAVRYLLEEREAGL